MSTRVTSRSAAGEREHHRSNLWHQLARFIGLFLVPFLGMFTAWLIHIWVVGVSVHWGRVIDWKIQPSPAAVTVAVFISALVTVGIAYFGWQLTAHRETVLRGSLAGSIGVVGAFFAINIGTGPHYWWSGLLLIAEWVVAIVWSIARLDVARKDARGEEAEAEGFWEKLGLSRKTKLKAKMIHDDETGEPVRIEAEVHHAPGETAEVFRDGGLASMESAAAAPGGMSSVSGNPARADRSTLSIPLVDPFTRPALVGPLSAPRKSIGEWITVADYANGRAARFTLGNGVHTPTPTSWGVIGMTRSGKTGTETQILTECGSRCDWVCLYLNQAKGLQDARPLLPIMEAVMIADDEAKAQADARVATKQVRNIMAYRQQQLARFAVSAWSPRCADLDESKRPSRLVDGRREHMEPMPMLTMFIGEADSLLADSRIADDVIFIGSKGLSLGVNVGNSLQKPDWKSMPTNLRSQIGLWFPHGLASADDEEFVIETSLRKSGVNPGSWGQKKPGQHYMIGTNTEDETLAVLAIKTRFIVGSDKDANGHRYSFDELNDRYMAEMLRRNTESAKYQARLDSGSANATGGWWAEQAAKAIALRSATPSATIPQTDPATSQPAEYVPPGLRGKPRPASTTPQFEIDDEPTTEEVNEMHEEAATVTEVEGVELYPDGEGSDVDATLAPERLPDPAPEDDPLYDPEDEAKPAARDRPAALAALAKAFDELLADESLRDPRDPEAVIIGPGMVSDRWPFRSRPFFSGEFSKLAEGQGELSARYVLALAEDLGIRRGKYRLRRVTDHDE